MLLLLLLALVAAAAPRLAQAANYQLTWDNIHLQSRSGYYITLIGGVMSDEGYTAAVYCTPAAGVAINLSLVQGSVGGLSLEPPRSSANSKRPQLTGPRKANQDRNAARFGSSQALDATVIVTTDSNGLLVAYASSQQPGTTVVLASTTACGSLVDLEACDIMWTPTQQYNLTVDPVMGYFKVSP
jgi:hypothetical protein